MNHTLPTIAACCCCAIASQQGIATMTYNTQYRSVDAYNQIAGYDWVWATDFEPFAVFIDRHSSGSGDVGFILDHHSSLEPERMSFSGSTWAGGGDRSGGTWFPMIARNFFDIDFTIDDATSYHATIQATSVLNTTIVTSLVQTPGDVPVFNGVGAFAACWHPVRTD